MFYWLIPYLVVYNTSNHGNWIYGPEHLFKVEVNTDMVFENEPKTRFEANILISCRPMNLSFIQCRVESATRDSYQFSTGSENDPFKSEDHTELNLLVNSTFQVGFDKIGTSNFTYVSKGFNGPNMIRAIVDGFNIGTDLSKEEQEQNLFEETSLNGNCETSFDIRKTPLPYSEKELTPIEGFNFDTPSFLERRENESIVINKTRKMNNCLVKRNYFFLGQTEKPIGHFKRALIVDTNITRSLTTIYLGQNGFRSYTENDGTLELKNAGMDSKVYAFEKGMKAKISEAMDIRLVSIRPATEELWDFENY